MRNGASCKRKKREEDLQGGLMPRRTQLKRRTVRKTGASSRPSLPTEAEQRRFNCGDYVLLRAPKKESQDTAAGGSLSRTIAATTPRGRRRSQGPEDVAEIDLTTCWIAQILKISRESTGNDERILVKWFYRMKDLYHWHTTVGHEEVFESEHLDENESDCVVGRCHIVCEMEWRMLLEKRTRSSSVSKQEELRVFLCRERYDFITGSFAPSTMTIQWIQEHQPDSNFVASSIQRDSFSHRSLLALLRYMVENSFPVDNDGDCAEQVDLHDTGDEDAWDPAEERALQLRLRSRQRAAAGRSRGNNCSQESDMTPRPRAGGQLLLWPSDVGAHEHRQSRISKNAVEFAEVSEPTGSVPRLLQVSRFGAPRVQLVCRDVETERVLKFLTDCLRGSSERCLYISGVPGTGKTAVVRCAVQQLEQRRQQGQVPHFQYIEINGMTIPDPTRAYNILLQRLGHRSTGAAGGRRPPAPAEAARLLDQRFRQRRGVHNRKHHSSILVLLDEMDALVLNHSAAAQRVLYDFLDWASRPASELVIIGIANTLDLPERLLPRLASRLGMNRQVFKPYSVTQLQQILRHKLGPQLLQHFDEDALELCTRRVAAVSGDIRRALAICLHAYARSHSEDCSLRASENEHDRLVSAVDIDEAIRELTPSSVQSAVKQLSQIEQQVLMSAALCGRQAVQQGSETFRFQQIWHRFRQFHASTEGHPAYPLPLQDQIEEVWHILMGLCACNLLSCSVPSSSCAYAGFASTRLPNLHESQFVLNPLFDDIAFAFRENLSFAQAAGELV